MAAPVGLKVGAFALAVMGTYTWYANSIPQLESRPPEELSLEGADVTPPQLAAAGEKIFREKGQCATCHTIGGPGGRGPDLGGIGGRAGTRKPGTSATAYLVESLVDPAAFLVPNYPSIMPRVDRPPIGLNRSELWATVAYLQSQGGEVAVKLDDIPATAGAQAGGGAPATVDLPGDPKAGRAVFAGKGTCIACHKAGAIGASPVGPDLSNIGASQTLDYVMGKILDPTSKGVVSGFPAGVMPATFGKTLTAQEFLDLTAFLMTLKGGGAPATPATDQPGAPAAPPRSAPPAPPKS